MSTSDLPQYLAERLAEDQAKFGNNRTKEELEQSENAHIARHKEFLIQKAAHAKVIGEGHHHTTTGDLESSVQHKRTIIEEQSKELKLLEERIKETDEKKKYLESKLQI